jgi:dethiobiotin synthetase
MNETIDNELLSLQNPYLFSLPASPHLAARLDNESVDIESLLNSSAALAQKSDFLLIEGAGGLVVPLNEEALTADVVARLSAHVIVIADNKLGVDNHTLLTIEALKSRCMNILGVIFNRSGKDTELPEYALKDNIEIIGKISGVNILGEVIDIENSDMSVIVNKMLEELS